MSPTHTRGDVQSFPVFEAGGPHSAVELETTIAHNEPTDLNGFSIEGTHDGHAGIIVSHKSMDTAEFSDFSFPYQDTEDLHGDNHMLGLDEHAPDLFTVSGESSIQSMSHRKTSMSSIMQGAKFNAGDMSQRRQSMVGSSDGSPEGTHGGANSLEDMSDDFGLSTNAPGDGTDLGAKIKDVKSDAAPAWSELKTKAGKERKRLPLACIACRRKKIRCSGEKPACKHCLRSRIPCVYKVTTRKAAPRTDYMAMLDKRLKRMEDRIIKILPKSDQDPSTSHVTRAIVKPAMPSSAPPGKQAGKKRGADEAFGPDLDHWARTPSKSKLDDPQNQNLLQVQEREDGKLLTEGRDALPSMDIREHLAEVFFETIYGQAYHLLHKPSYMRKLKADTLPPVLVLSVCAIAARFSTHPSLARIPNFLRGEEWAAAARDIVMKRYDWPNITVLTCLLILGLHEFGTCHGGRSWSLGGQAIRMAFALQLHKDLECDPTKPNPPQLSFIDREIRRRTMWACFLMDRFMSSGTDRPMFVKEETVKIQLPIKEKLFQLDMPGPTEDLQGEVRHAIPDDGGQLSSAKSNMGVAAYMVRSIALWGKIINFLNQGGKESEQLPMWDPDSGYSYLLKQAEDLAEGLPDGLTHTPENLHLHDTEGMANQFLFLHISIQQSILFMNRFAVSSPSKLTLADVPQSFITEAGAKAFRAANSISELLREGEQHMIAAPFVGYCAFLSSTVHIFGIFSGNAAVEQSSKKNLGTNVRFLAKMKRYWGMFHFMSENLREQYRTCADAARQGKTSESATSSPVFQYGDWFDRYPHGVSHTDFLDPAAFKKKDSGDDAVLEQKPETYTVEEFFTQLSPPESAVDREGGAPKNLTRRKSMVGSSKKGTAPSRSESLQLESILTDVNSPPVPEHVQQRLQEQRRQYISRLGGQTSGPTSIHPQISRIQGSQNAGTATYQTPSPISPVAVSQHPFAAAAAGAQGHPGFYNHHEMLQLGLASNAAGILPQLDRQLVFGAYGGLDPSMTGAEGLMDWDHMAANGHSQEDQRRDAPHRPTTTSAEGGGGGGGGGVAFGTEPSSAWFMPFNIAPPEMGQEVSGAALNGMDVFSPTMFSPGMTTPGGGNTAGGGLGMREGSHR